LKKAAYKGTEGQLGVKNSHATRGEETGSSDSWISRFHSKREVLQKTNERDPVEVSTEGGITCSILANASQLRRNLPEGPSLENRSATISKCLQRKARPGRAPHSKNSFTEKLAYRKRGAFSSLAYGKVRYGQKNPTSAQTATAHLLRWDKKLRERKSMLFSRLLRGEKGNTESKRENVWAIAAALRKHIAVWDSGSYDRAEESLPE